MEYVYLVISALIIIALLIIFLMKNGKKIRKPSNFTPLAPLQKRALYSLAIEGLLAMAFIIIVVLKDINTFGEDLGFRLMVYALWVGTPLVYLITVNLTLNKPGQIDERDKLIMAKAPRVQFWAVLLSLVAWTIALTEAFSEQGQVPVIFLNLIMISTLIFSTIAQSAGILFGYWGGGSND